MLNTSNILKAFKMLLMIFSVALTLTACSNDEKNSIDRAPVSQEEAAAENESSAVNQWKKTDPTKCWQTNVVNTLYNLMGETALENYHKMTGGALALMMVAFAIWMSIRLMQHVSSMTEESMGEVWYEIAKKFFLCFVCGLIASQTDLLVFVLGKIIFPIYNAFLEFASELLAAAVKSAGATKATVFGEQVSINTSFTCAAGKMDELSADSTSFPESPKVMMNCMICAMDSSLSFGITLAFATMAGSHVTGYIVGFLVLCCFLFVKLAFVFYLVDTIFRFTIMVVMLPLMIMGYPFQASRKLLSSGVANMLNSAGFMMFFAIIITMCILAIAEILKQFQNVFTDSKTPFMELSVPFICIMMIGFLVISSLKVAGQLCDKIVGGKSNSEFQKDAKALIVGAIKMVGSFGMRMGLMFVPKSVRDGVANKAEKLLNIKNKVGGRVDKMAGK